MIRKRKDVSYDVRDQLRNLGVKTIVIDGIPTPVGDAALYLCHAAMDKIRSRGVRPAGLRI